MNHLLPLVSLAKGTPIDIPIRYMNRDKDIWGSDGHDFNPYRWLDEGKDTLPEGAREFPSLSFPVFLAGSYGCVGFRFAIMECVFAYCSRTIECLTENGHQNEGHNILDSEDDGVQTGFARVGYRRRDPVSIL